MLKTIQRLRVSVLVITIKLNIIIKIQIIRFLIYTLLSISLLIVLRKLIILFRELGLIKNIKELFII